MKAKINNTLVKKLVHEDKEYEVHDTDLIGFLLRVFPSGICGDEDLICPPADIKKFADLILDSQMVIFPEAGHLLSLEYPSRFVQVIGDFLLEKEV